MFASKPNYGVVSYECEILTRFNKKYFDKATVIIPFGIDSQIKLNKYPEYNHKFLVCDDEDVYDTLNDKIIDYYEKKEY